MTVPEENRAKTRATDDTTEQRRTERNRTRDQDAGATGRTLREALEEAQVRPDDFQDH